MICYEEQRKEDGQRTPYLVSILTHFKHEATRFPCLKGCCDLKYDACGPTFFFGVPPSRFDLVFAGTDAGRTRI